MRVISGFLAIVVSGTPVLAQQPIHNAVAREASRIAAEQPDATRGTRMRLGAAVAAAGAGIAILGATAFRTARTTSGNTPPSSFSACEAIKSNPVYANNRCDVLKGPNLAIVGSGTAVATLGITLMALGSSHSSSVELAPTGVRFVRRVKF